MSINIWESVDSFLNDLSKSKKYPREELFFEAELRTGGPTVQPGPASKEQIKSQTVAAYGKALPYAGYDTLGSNHMEYRVYRMVGGKVKVKKVLYSWQMHPFPGNCGVCVYRWVRLMDTNKWSPSLQKKALILRASLSRAYGYGVVTISTGNSFKGAERLRFFKKTFEGVGRGPMAMYVLDLRKFLKTHALITT